MLVKLGCTVGKFLGNKIMLWILGKRDLCHCCISKRRKWGFLEVQGTHPQERNLLVKNDVIKFSSRSNQVIISESRTSMMSTTDDSHIKGSVSTSMPCTCRLSANLCLSPFSWPMKMATTKANQETTRARHAG